MGKRYNIIYHTMSTLNAFIRKRFSFIEKVHIIFLILIIGGIITGVYLISEQRLLRSKADIEIPLVRAFFTIDAPLKQRGKEFQLIITLNPHGSSFYGFDLYFTYDKEKVELATNFLDDIGQTYDANKGFFKRIEKDKDADKIQIYGAKLGGAPLSGNENIEIAKIRFKLRDKLTDGEKILFTWDRENTKLAGDKVVVALDMKEGRFVFGSDQITSQEEIVQAPIIHPQESAPLPTESVQSVIPPVIPPTSQPTSPPVVIPTIIPTLVPPQKLIQPTSPVVIPQQNALTFLIKFQGVSQKPKRSVMPVLITVKGGSLTKPLSQIIQFTADDGGIWKGALQSSSIPKGYSYSFSVKGPYHKEVLFCHQAPIEKKPGDYRCSDSQISIVADTQVFDFSHVILPVGDLQSRDGPADGVINSRDAVFVRTNLLTHDAKIRDKVDVNGDEESNVIDYALVLKGLEIQQ